MSWVRAYLAMSSMMAVERDVAVASLAQMPAREAEEASGGERRVRASMLAGELVHIAAALEEAGA